MRTTRASLAAAIVPSFLGLASQQQLVSAQSQLYQAASAFLANAQISSSAAAPASTSSASNALNGGNNTAGSFNGTTPIFRTCAQSGTYAITFDDGPQANEAAIMNLLDQEGVKGTFFVNGNNWACIYDPASVAVLQATYAAGHQIGNHGWGHDHSSQLNTEQFTNQVQWVEEALVKILGIMPNMFRFPYGDFNDDNMSVLSARNYSASVLWDSLSGQATGTSIQQSQSNYQANSHTFPAPHITLNHEQDDDPITQVLPQAIQELKAAGYKLVTASECLGIPAYKSVGQPQQRDATWTCDGKPGPGQPGP